MKSGLRALFVCSANTIAFVSAVSAAVPRGSSLAPQYVAEFDKCDRTNVFEEVKLPVTANGRRWYGCEDHSRLVRLEELGGSSGHSRAIVFVAKAARDDDGSSKACSKTKGHTDQCQTSLMLLPTPNHPCMLNKDALGRCVPVNAAEIPYIAIPNDGPSPKSGPQFASVQRSRFRRITGVAVGDFAVVSANGRNVAAIVADSGPWNKIGEASAALLAKLSGDGKPRTIGSGVTYTVFPGSALPYRQLNADALRQVVTSEACKHFRAAVSNANAQCT